jgi:hypothetical protein
MTSTRANTTRDELIRVVRARPFEPFAITLENGERVILNHPENIAFDPEPGGSVRFHVIANNMVTASTLDAITSVTALDRGAAV